MLFLSHQQILELKRFARRLGEIGIDSSNIVKRITKSAVERLSSRHLVVVTKNENVAFLQIQAFTQLIQRCAKGGDLSTMEPWCPTGKYRRVTPSATNGSLRSIFYCTVLVFIFAFIFVQFFPFFFFFKFASILKNSDCKWKNKARLLSV